MSVDFKLVDFCYPVSILRLRRFFERSQWFSHAQLIEYQEARLQEIIRHAYDHVPYYRDLFRRLKLVPGDIRHLADLPKIPLLSKATLRSELRRLQATNKDRYHPRWETTSGTSGEPVRFLLDKPSNVLEFVYYWRHWSWAGYRLGHRFAELSSHFFMKQRASQQTLYYWQRGTRRLLLNSLSISAESAQPYAQIIRRYRPLFLKGLPSALSYFALSLGEAGITDLSFKGIFATGEMLLAHQRKLIERTFHCKVYDSYGHMERTVAISECPDGGLHSNPEYGVLELADKTPTHSGDLTDSGKPAVRGRIIGTSLHNFSMPLLRYKVGDMAEVEEDSPDCRCGRRMPRVRRINGRQQDVIITPEGRVITTLFIVFDEVPGVSAGQVIQETINRLRVRIARSPEYTEDSEAALLAYLRRFVGPHMGVDLEYVSQEAIRGPGVGKFRTIISNISRPAAVTLPDAAPNGHEIQG